MKKILLIVAILMLAAPAFAVTVTITARPGDDVNEVEIWYEVNEPVLGCPDGNRPRAFGLNISVTDGNIIDINVPFEGECDDVNRGYGIFPGTISIADGEVTGWGGPIAPDDDPGAEGTGLDTNTIIIEMGSLYTGVNCPDPCAMLCFIVVNLDCNVSIAGDASRTGTGSPATGVILESLGAVTVNWPPPYSVVGVSRFVPDVTNMTQTAAETAIEAEDLVPGDVTEECHPTIVVGNIVRTDPIAGTEVPQGTEIDLVKSRGACDFGDAPDPTYPTLLASNGARHIIGGGNLGANVDADADGQPNATATGDDIAGATPDDEDGVLIGVLVKGGNNNVTVIASVAGNLNAWLDLNADGDWADAGEQIFTNQALIAGPNPLNIPVACGATSGQTMSRWRFTTGISIPDTNEYGLEIDGEVEDHNVTIACHVPDVCDMNVADATAALEDACFNLGTTYYECSDTVDACDVTRADPPYCTYPECGSSVDIYVSTGPCCTYPACWDWAGQCEGDCVNDDGKVDTEDLLLAFKPAFGGVYPAAKYNPCADFDRDGDIDTEDLLLVFKPNFGQTGLTGCTPGDPHGIYCP